MGESSLAKLRFSLANSLQTPLTVSSRTDYGRIFCPTSYDVVDIGSSERQIADPTVSGLIYLTGCRLEPAWIDDVIVCVAWKS